MGATQIKGHRIGDKQIEQKHLHDSFILPEDRLKLNHPTHSDAGDLTVAQKNTLTQMGNGDSLHYHTGGGGGPQGIYTNAERDVQLLKLSMLVSATKWGMDKSVKDLFDDDASIYYGFRNAISPTLINITDDPSIGGLLPANTSFTYGIAFKTQYGETEVSNTTVITTGSGTNNSIKISIDEAPTGNKGMKLFRSSGNVERVIVENENINEWVNPYNLDVALNGTDKTAGLSSFKVSTKGFTNANGSIIRNSSNIAYGVGRRVLNDGQQLNVQILQNPPFEYLIQINNKAIAARLDIIWDSNPSQIPLSYEVYYTTDYIPTDITSVKWNKFERLSKFRTAFNSILSISTDGDIIDNYKVTNNTRSQNIFSFKAVANITAIKIKVINVQSKCQLNDIRLFTETNSTNLSIFKDFNGPQDFREFKTLKIDVKSNARHKDNLKIAFEKSSEVISNTANDISYNSTTSMNLTGNTIRTRYGSGSWNRYGYDRVRIQLSPEPNQYLKLENIFIHIDNKSGHLHSTTGYDIGIDAVVVPVTFNNGLSYYDGVPTGPIYSDWLPIQFPNISFNSYVVSMRVVTGTLKYYNYTYTETYSTSTNGYEGDLIWNGYVNVNSNYYDYGFIQRVEVGKSNSQYMDFDNFVDSVAEKWHRHYIPLPNGEGSNDVRNLRLLFNNITLDQDIFIDNVSLSRSDDTVRTLATITGSNGCTNPAYVKLTDDNVFGSDLTPTNAAPKSIMFEYSATQQLNKLLIFFGNKSTAGRSYAIQYTTDLTANVNDAVGDTKWLPISGIVIGEPGIPQEFTGTILENVIYDNNVWASHTTHTFDTVECRKIRIIFFATIGDIVLRVNNIKIMTAADMGELKLIYEKNTLVNPGDYILDDGKPTGTLTPNALNTTGSYNIYYDSSLGLIRVIDPTKQGVIHFKQLELGLYIHLLMTAQTTGNVNFYVSNDTGLIYNKISLDQLYDFTAQSKSLRIKITLDSADATLNAIALLYSL